PALWELDSDPAGFWWIEPNDADSNVIAFARASRDGERVVVFATNLSPVPRPGYRLGLPRACRWREALNTDSTFYGGSDAGNLGGVEPVAGSAPAKTSTSSVGQGQAAEASPGHAPAPTAPASVTGAPAKGAPTDAEVRAAVARFQLAVARYHLNQLDFPGVLLKPTQ